MKASVYNRYGSPDVLQLKEIAEPIPKNDEVLIKVYASSINSWDWDLLTGKPYLYRLLFGILRPKFKVLGADVAGKVVAVGKDVKHLKPGDEVFGDISGCNWGGFAEFVCASENVFALKSPQMTFEEAAAFPQASVLAWQGLQFNSQIKEGQSILINGAGGGVGTFAIQIAKSFGAVVTAVDRASKLDMLRSIGADYVIDFKQQDLSNAGKSYDFILDVFSQRSIFDYKRMLNPNGTYVMLGGTIGRLLQTALLGPLLSRTGKKMGILVHVPKATDLQLMNELFEAGKVVPVIDKRYRLNQVAEAFQYFGSSLHKGKIVISVEHNNPT